MEFEFHNVPVTLSDLVAMIALQIRHRLPGVGPRPANIDSRDGRGVAEAYFLPQRIGTKAPTAAYHSVEFASPRRRLQCDLDTCADGGAVGFHADQFQFEPMVGIARIQEERIPRKVPGVRAA